MGHGHGEPPYKVPPYDIYHVKGIPQLEELEKALCAKGLKDPWIRNEAWRYNPGFGTKMQRAKALFFRGLPIGVLLAAGHAFFDKAMGGGHHVHIEDEVPKCD